MVGLQTPLADMLRAAQGGARLHMPGHKGCFAPGMAQACGAALPLGWDMTELPRTDDLFAPERGIAQAEALAAQAAGAAHTLLLSAGATPGILAMVLACVPPGGTLIVGRNCHHSVLSACVWGDIRPVFVWPRALAGTAAVLAADVLAAMEAHPEAAAVLLTRPDYMGVCTDVTPVAQAARARGMRVLVDEAHGAHFSWPVPGQPIGAGACGADAWVQSAHKTLPALTGAAWLHLAQTLDAPRVRRTLRMVHTASPSFLTLASLDGARAWMDAHGADALRALHARVRRFWAALAGTGYRDAHLPLADVPGLACDPARVVADTAAHGYTGHEAAAHLAARGIDVEMADARCVVLLPGLCPPAEGEEDALGMAARALCALPRRAARAHPGAGLPEVPPACVYPVRAAALGEQTWVPLAQAGGRVAAVSAGLYPPGIPWVVPGERIAPQTARALGEAAAMGAQCFGVERDGLFCAP